MTIQLDVLGAPPGTPSDRRRPNVAGDLPTVFRAAPMFDRALVGYDRFQVETYVQWAEDELGTAEREREHLMALHLRTQAELEDARALLHHSPGGGELVLLSRRIGSMLAAAADEAEGIRADARAERSAASAEAQRVAARADALLADAEARGQQVVAEATRIAAGVTAEADRLRAEAEAARRSAAAEVAAERATLRRLGARAAEDAAEVRRQAARDAAAAVLQARAEVVGMLATGREQRRRADEEAAAVRHRLDTEAADRRAALLAEVADLERRHAALRGAVGPPSAPAAARIGGRPAAVLRSLGARLGLLRRS